MPRTKGGVAYEMHGSGRAAVLLHGLTLDRHTWAPIVAALAGSVRTVAIDLPLHGESRQAPGGIELATRAVLDVLDAEQIVSPILVGHSLGAVIAAGVAGARPAHASIHIDQPLHLGAFPRAVQAATARRPPPPALGELLPAFRARLGLDALTPEARALVTAHSDPREEQFLAYWGDLLDGDPDALDTRIAGWLRASRAPLLAIHARDPGAHYRGWLQALAPAAAIEVWPEGGHFPHLARPDALSEAIRRLAR